MNTARVTGASQLNKHIVYILSLNADLTIFELLFGYTLGFFVVLLAGQKVIRF